MTSLVVAPPLSTRYLYGSFVRRGAHSASIVRCAMQTLGHQETTRYPHFSPHAVHRNTEQEQRLILPMMPLTTPLPDQQTTEALKKCSEPSKRALR